MTAKRAGRAERSRRTPARGRGAAKRQGKRRRALGGLPRDLAPTIHARAEGQPVRVALCGVLPGLFDRTTAHAGAVDCPTCKVKLATGKPVATLVAEQIAEADARRAQRTVRALGLGPGGLPPLPRPVLRGPSSPGEVVHFLDHTAPRGTACNAALDRDGVIVGGGFATRTRPLVTCGACQEAMRAALGALPEAGASRKATQASRVIMNVIVERLREGIGFHLDRGAPSHAKWIRDVQSDVARVIDEVL
jgi:hypothetical protein